ncbi:MULTISPECIES: class I SAM-dependent methyltransferase [unclassified Sphingomonas]|uniref:class I SAM-dependent methyltransferase n=1 Tax=unclassified Sphingomonas TaxID=196159 RepID=UPI0007007E2A|nr:MULTISPECIES: class I SAM-dependent methyltransferase [unclassified Sphingomonas]KQX25427.1 methyltransferase [Sphingomonas sp. Root1294]KQY66419.1 methyltransferase [Sphingomonas sp. Root50]KRB90264.1 methyltransferase [Sphingomonas sp. Root720]
MDRATYDRMAEIDQDHWWFVARRRIIAALIERHRPKPGPMRILEVGAGTGSNLDLLKRYGTVDAIEPDDGARAFAERRSGLRIKGGYLPNVPLDDGAYDLIVLLDVLEHIPGDVEALAHLRGKLAPGGRILVTVPGAPWMWSAHDVAHHHQRRYTGAGLRAVFGQAGLKPRFMTHFNSVLFPLIAAVRLIRKVGGKEGGDDAMPSRPVNAILKGLFGAERFWVASMPLPFGVSIAIVGEPKV